MTAAKIEIFVILVLLGTTVGVAAAWISRETGRTIAMSVRDATIGFAGAVTLGVVVLSGFGVLG